MAGVPQVVGDEAAAPPVAADEAAAPPVAADETAVSPVAAGEAAVSPVAADEAAVSPVAADEAAAPPVAADEAAARPGIPGLVHKLEDPPMRSVRPAGLPRLAPPKTAVPVPESALFWEPTESAQWESCSAGPALAPCSACPTLAPLSAYSSGPSSTPRAWPTVPTLDPPPAHLPRHFSVFVCGASWICSLRRGGGLCHGPAGVPWPATRCPCMLSTWLVVCC